MLLLRESTEWLSNPCTVRTWVLITTTRSILRQAFRTSLADGWGGSRIATMASDILFGTPAPVKSQSNLGVLKENTVNIVVHGHEPELSEMLAVAVCAPDIVDYAKKSRCKRYYPGRYMLYR